MKDLTILGFFAVIGLYLGVAVLYIGIKAIVQDTSNILELLREHRKAGTEAAHRDAQENPAA